MPREEFMRRALALARTHNPAPNPRVGAVLVRDGRIIGEGAHRCPGEPHAEVNAVRSAGSGAAEADLYVTLEPCCHRGGGKRTPPCTELIIGSGIRRVFIASEDPNPEVAGRGAAALRAAGVEVECGLLKEEERLLNREYHHFRNTGLPWIHLKQAVSLDGYISAQEGRPTRLSCDKARAEVHRLRSSRQAVLCGGATVIADDPALTVRYAGGRNPLRLIVEGRTPVPLDSKVFTTADAPTILYASEITMPRLERLGSLGVDVVKTDGSLSAVFRDAAARGIISILIEAGSRMASAVIDQQLADEISLFYSPNLLGGGVPMTSGGGCRFDEDCWTAAAPGTFGTDFRQSWLRRASVCSLG